MKFVKEGVVEALRAREGAFLMLDVDGITYI